MFSPPDRVGSHSRAAIRYWREEGGGQSREYLIVSQSHLPSPQLLTLLNDPVIAQSSSRHLQSSHSLSLCRRKSGGIISLISHTELD